MLIRICIAAVCLLMLSAHASSRAADVQPSPPALGLPMLGPKLAQLTSPPPFLAPEQSLPANGAVRKENRLASIAPLRVITTGSSHHLLKLFDVSTARSKAPKSVLSVFVRAGSTAQIDVPIGTYVIRSAAGEKWYGYKLLFGPETSFSELDDTFSFTRQGNRVSGHSITLYAVPSGNLSTSASDAAAFGD
jgi:hypothetical protein